MIEEAGSSKYKNALHSKAFDTAVKKYRLRENQETEKLAAKTRPQIPRTHTDTSLSAAAEAAQSSAQQALERLPNKILEQAQNFHKHMQYFTNSGDNNWQDATGQTSTQRTRIPKELRSLLDELAELEDIGERTKRDIVEDDDARNVSVFHSAMFKLESHRPTHTDAPNAQYRT